jgi:hypothetical protein
MPQLGEECKHALTRDELRLGGGHERLDLLFKITGRGVCVAK